jgi:hydroxymethylglutaryl-CoA synthase
VKVSAGIKPSTSKRSMTVSHKKFDHFPRNVGIHGLEVYFPKTYVKQKDLEHFDNVGAGKYTVGLEQENMAFVNDREDIYSMSLTALQSLVEKYGLSYKDIGRLEVGTETLIDKSKSVKSVLMSLFKDSGNYNVEGIDTINACYGGTQALLNAVNWVESSSWDGRYAVVVTGDIAVYAPGPARPTGGAGVVAMLVGKDAPIVLERGARGSHVEHVWDFYKPNLESEYPVVDGHLSINCYYRALDGAYDLYKNTFKQTHGENFGMDKADYSIFHSPFFKLVRKSFARLYYQDFVDPRTSGHPRFAKVNPHLKTLTPEKSYNDKDVAKVFGDIGNEEFNKKVEPSALLPKNLGNSYTASMYTGLASLLSQAQELENKRVLMFSYGSGMAATMYSLQFHNQQKLSQISQKLDIKNRLHQRKHVTPQEYTEVMKLREDTHSKANYKPVSSVDDLFPGTFYLEHIDAEKRRYYSRKL